MGLTAWRWSAAAVKGAWMDHRDCHVRGDWILIYRINDTAEGEEVIFVRTGTHSELFD